MSQKIVVQLPQVAFKQLLRPTEEKVDGWSENSNRNIRRACPTVLAVPVIINFQRLLANPEVHDDIFKGISNKDLLHAVAALYDQSLPEVTEDIIYSSICDKWARTILIVQEYEDALEDFKIRALSKNKSKSSKSEKTLDGKNNDNRCITKHSEEKINDIIKVNDKPQNDGSKVLLPENRTIVKNSEIVQTTDSNSVLERLNSSDIKDSSKVEESRFAHVFSDMESENSEDDEEEDENYMAGVDDFLEEVKSRKEAHERWLELLKINDCSGEPTKLLGIEHRLLGCATFEQSYEKPGQKIIQLTLIAARKRYRKMGLGRYMTKILRNPALAGRYDAIVVNADHNAIDFFEKEGFSDDVLLNSKYADIGDTWYNCKRMCFLPPYQSEAYDSQSVGERSVSNIFYDDLEDLDLKQMELDLALFQEKSLQAFQAQATITQRLRKEVISLRARVAAQSDAIKILTKENHDVRDAKYACEKELLKLKLSTMTSKADSLLDFEMNMKLDEPGDQDE